MSPGQPLESFYDMFEPLPLLFMSYLLHISR